MFQNIILYEFPERISGNNFVLRDGFAVPLFFFDGVYLEKVCKLTNFENRNREDEMTVCQGT